MVSSLPAPAEMAITVTTPWPTIAAMVIQTEAEVDRRAVHDGRRRDIDRRRNHDGTRHGRYDALGGNGLIDVGAAIRRIGIIGNRDTRAQQPRCAEYRSQTQYALQGGYRTECHRVACNARLVDAIAKYGFRE